MSREGEMTFTEFTALCSSLFPDVKGFEDKTSSRALQFSPRKRVMAKIANDEKKIEAKSPKKRPATVYAATVIFGGAKLELRMSYPISGDLRVNIYTIPHRVEAIENASPTEEALRQFAAQLLASQ